MSRIALWGNFQVPYCTEVHYGASLESLGHEVTRLQEGEVRATQIAQRARGHDLLLWVQTFGLAETGGTNVERLQALEDLRAASIPSLGVHLDRWWGLARAEGIQEQAFFRVDHLFTSDGGHEEQWQALGINHRWMPPAVYHAEADNGTPRAGYRSDICFVGSWRHYGHEEWWPQRRAMLAALRRSFPGRVRFWPRARAIRGQDLNDLYASTKVVVGDSCLAPKADGSPMTHYVSDRVFETIGRGGFLVHPHVEGCFPELLEDGTHLVTYPLGDYEQMRRLVAHYLEHDEERERIRAAGAAHVRADHTYRNRLADVLRVVTEDKEAVA